MQAIAITSAGFIIIKLKSKKDRKGTPIRRILFGHSRSCRTVTLKDWLTYAAMDGGGAIFTRVIVAAIFGHMSRNFAREARNGNLVAFPTLYLSPRQ